MRSFAFTSLATAAALFAAGAASAGYRSQSGPRTACCGVAWAPVDRRGPTFPADDFLLPDSAWNGHSPSTAGTAGPNWTLRQPVFGPPLPTLPTPRRRPYIILNETD
ncbi:hypothetical protein [Hyphomicrobium sp. ghe19]|uniref:hypothetical protein n=1 Tax=Hyphomicrobium sp. ghe19 TaxID=2682968 RepID=UPI0013670F5B|nr:hypothetical protein HYPP_00898 [Hyphomicrobium sp. ghe19]